MSSKHNPRKMTLAMIKGKPIATSVPVIHYHASDDELEEIYPNSEDEKGSISDVDKALPKVTSGSEKCTEKESSTQESDVPENSLESRSIGVEHALPEGTPPSLDPWKMLAEIKGKITKTFEEKLSEMKSEKKKRRYSKAETWSDLEDQGRVTPCGEKIEEKRVNESTGTIDCEKDNPVRYMDFTGAKTGIKDKSLQYECVESGVEASEFTENVNEDVASCSKKDSSTAEALNSDSSIAFRQQFHNQSVSFFNQQLDFKIIFSHLLRQLIFQTTYKSLAVFVAIISIYYIAPLPDYLLGFMMGVFLTVTSYSVLSKLQRLLTTLPDEKYISTRIIPVLEIPAAEEHAVVERFQGWLNELPYTYEPNNYHVARTKSVFFRLEGNILRIMETRIKIPKKAVWDEPKYKLKFVRRRMYNLTGAKIELVPYGLARRRRWSKKYPICITLKKRALICNVSLKNSTNGECSNNDYNRKSIPTSKVRQVKYRVSDKARVAKRNREGYIEDETCFIDEVNETSTIKQSGRKRGDKQVGEDDGLCYNYSVNIDGVDDERMEHEEYLLKNEGKMAYTMKARRKGKRRNCKKPDEPKESYGTRRRLKRRDKNAKGDEMNREREEGEAMEVMKVMKLQRETKDELGPEEKDNDCNDDVAAAAAAAIAETDDDEEYDDDVHDDVDDDVNDDYYYYYYDDGNVRGDNENGDSDDQEDHDNANVEYDEVDVDDDYDEDDDETDDEEDDDDDDDNVNEGDDDYDDEDDDDDDDEVEVEVEVEEEVELEMQEQSKAEKNNIVVKRSEEMDKEIKRGVIDGESNENCGDDTDKGKEKKREEEIKFNKSGKMFKKLKRKGKGKRKKELKIFVFARADREKEDWYRRLISAASRYAKKRDSLSFATDTSPTSNVSLTMPRNINVETKGASLSTNSSHERNMTELNYNAYMAKYLDTDTSNVLEEASAATTCHDNTLWINCLIGRVLFDLHNCPETINLIQDKIQRKLSRIKLPYFMECLLVSEVAIGQGAPIIRNVTKPISNERGLWLDFDITYKGSLTMTVETKLNLMKLTRASSVPSNSNNNNNDNDNDNDKNNGNLNSTSNVIVPTEKRESITKSPIFDSDLEDTPETSTEDEDANQMQFCNSGKETTTAQSSGRKFLNMVDRIAANKYFQHATELSYIRRAMEGVSNTEIRLMVTVSSIEGCLSVNIPPAPSDRLWYAFKPVPKVTLTVKPAVGERTVNIVYVTKWIEAKLLREFEKLVVLPNMDDFVIPLCPNYPYVTTR